MNLTSITTTLSKLTGRTGLILKKHSPEILVVTGIVGIVGSTILACRATLKVEEVLDTHKEKTDKIAECWDKVEAGEIDLSEYSEQDHKKDLTVAYVQTTVDFVKLYGPAVALGVASIACIIGGHGILRKRNVALIAAYKAIEEGFKAYRNRVIEEYGEEKDYIFKHGLREEHVVESVVGEDGKTTKVKKTKLITDPNGLSVYARFFDEGCTQWSKTPEYNLLFVRNQQNYYNDLLKSRGHVFLNEVYDALGIPRSQAGQRVGWVVGKGDGYIDFGIYDQNGQMRNRDFVNGYERSILLDFNVDGVIDDLLEQ